MECVHCKEWYPNDKCFEHLQNCKGDSATMQHERKEEEKVKSMNVVHFLPSFPLSINLQNI